MARTDRGVQGYGDRVGIAGWVYRGTTQPPLTPREEDLDTAKRAPEALQGLEWVVSRSGRVSLGVRRRGRYPPPLPAVGPAPLGIPQNAASGPIRARFSAIFLKVSQNAEVSPK